ncbi:MAG TPA: proton-conducting transporter membrane subunit [Polyangiaceae bacterium]|nr:proton-conducting transporter membrane subunit [Polyangiaceae bacterium]
MSATLLWMAAIASPPLVVVTLGRAGLAVERLRTTAAACAAMCVLACAIVFVSPELGALRLPWPVAGAHPALGASLFHVSELSKFLLPLPSTLWLVSVAVTPRSRLDSAGLQRTAAATLSTTLAFLTESPVLLVALWMVSNLLFVSGLSPTEHRRARRVASAYLWTSAAFLGSGVALESFATAPMLRDAGVWLVVVAVLIRKGIFPFHAWIPEVFDSGRMGPIIRFSAPQLGSWIAVVLVVPHASAGVLRALAILSLITAVYGAALALVQRDARRACGYLFVSQSALVLAGLDCTSPQALAGSLVLWLSSALAFTGLTRTVLALEVRRGRLDLTRYHGGYEELSQLAVSFLVLGLACTGFPGTLGFIGQEMLVEGAVREFPALGFFVLAAAALTGLAVLRMYFSLFCGARSTSFGLRRMLLRRERLAFGALTVLLVAGGLLPRTIVASRLEAGHAMLREREHTSAPAHP